MEFNPEVFAQVIMLYVNMDVGNCFLCFCIAFCPIPTTRLCSRDDPVRPLSFHWQAADTSSCTAACNPTELTPYAHTMHVRCSQEHKFEQGWRQPRQPPCRTHTYTSWQRTVLLDLLIASLMLPSRQGGKDACNYHCRLSHFSHELPCLP